MIIASTLKRERNGKKSERELLGWEREE